MTRLSKPAYGGVLAFNPMIVTGFLAWAGYSSAIPRRKGLSASVMFITLIQQQYLAKSMAQKRAG